MQPLLKLRIREMYYIGSEKGVKLEMDAADA